MNKHKDEPIEISVKTAWIALECLHDWLEYVDCLDDETRRKIAALDELVQALDAESWITDKRDQERARAEAAWKARQAEEEAKKKKGKN
jgi:hypothetical protein